MTRNIYMGLAFCIFGLFLILGCDSGQQAQPLPVQTQVQPLPVQPPVAVPQPVAQPVAPPPTPLVPIADVKENDDSRRPKGRTTKVDDIDKPLPGPKTEGDELIGNYSCKFDLKGLPLGPFKLPPFGCRIFRADDGNLKLGSTSRSIASLRGNINNPTAIGFFVVGQYKFPGNKLGIKARMQRKPGAQVQYSGKGRGMLNDNKQMKKEYTLTMIKK